MTVICVKYPHVKFGNEKDAFFISKRIFANYHEKHVHNFFEILYVFSGKRCFFINDRAFKIKAGDLILIGPNVLHNAISDEAPDCEGILLHFQEGFLVPNRPIRQTLAPLFEREPIAISFSINEQALVEALFLTMLQEEQSKPIGYELALQSALLQLLVFLDRYIVNHQIAAFEHPSPVHEKVSEIAEYINRHYMKPLSLTTLAEHFFISPNYLSKIFKEVTNFTFVDYLNHVRVKEAKLKLMQTRKKVVHIAAEVGFGSVTHFGRVFKEITGNPPLYYRKERIVPRKKTANSRNGSDHSG